MSIQAMDTYDERVAQQIERFQSILFGPGVDSQTRAEHLADLIEVQNADVFWPVFINTWNSCDDTWRVRKRLLRPLRWHQFSMRKRGWKHLSGDDLAFYKSLPDPVTIYRGCSARRVRGISWTTDKDVAAGFAIGHRGLRVPRPVIASAVIPKKAIFVALQDRKESEVVVDPDKLYQLKRVPWRGDQPEIAIDPAVLRALQQSPVTAAERAESRRHFHPHCNTN